MIRVQNLYKKWDEIPILENLNCEFPDNEITAIMGPSGCGKTTFLHILAGLDRHFTGTIEGLPERTAYCFQEERLLPWKTVLGNILFVLDKPEFEKINSILKILELNDFKNYPIQKLSGGMRQRAALARAFAYPSELLILDEPFRSLDAELKEKILIQLQILLKENPKTCIFVTHDSEEASRFAKKTIFFQKTDK